jgi:hypothetical protein
VGSVAFGGKTTNLCNHFPSLTIAFFYGVKLTSEVHGKNFSSLCLGEIETLDKGACDSPLTITDE